MLEKIDGNLKMEKYFSAELEQRNLLVAPWVHFKATGIWDSVLHLGEPIFLSSGHYLAKPGDVLNGIYLLVSGEIAVIDSSNIGLKRYFATSSAKSLIGDVCFFRNKISYYTYLATNDCKLFFFTEEIIEKAFLPLYPEIVDYILKSISRKSAIKASLLREASFCNLKTRLARLLYLLAKENGELNKNGKYVIKVSQINLAKKLGVHRVSITKNINCLKDIGLISLRPSKITIESFEMLKEIIDTT